MDLWFKGNLRFEKKSMTLISLLSKVFYVPQRNTVILKSILGWRSVWITAGGERRGGRGGWSTTTRRCASRTTRPANGPDSSGVSSRWGSVFSCGSGVIFPDPELLKCSVYLFIMLIMLRRRKLNPTQDQKFRIQVWNTGSASQVWILQ